MHRKFYAFLLMCLGLVCQAQSLVDQQIDSLISSTKVINIDSNRSENNASLLDSSLRRQISAFYYDQFRHFQDPGAPYFLFMSKDSQLAMGIGGTVRMRGYFDWGGAITQPGFAPYLIPIHPNPAEMRNLATTPAGTCLFFRVLGQNKALGNYQLYIEANFNGYGARDFHLKKAYAIVNDFTVGMAASTFSDPAAVPPTVDAQGPNNKITPSPVLIRYMPVVKDRWVFAVSAETATTARDIDGVNTEKVKDWLPDGAAFVEYMWEKGQHIRLAGIIRSLPYRDLIKGQNHNVAGWGVQLSSVAHPLPQLTTYITANYGKGYAGLSGDFTAGNYDLIADPRTPGEMYAPRAFGWCVGLQYNFKPNLFATATMSQSRFLPDYAIAGNDYKYGLFWCANVFWNPTPRITLAAELDLGKRMNFDGDHRYARRIGAMCQFAF